MSQGSNHVLSPEGLKFALWCRGAPDWAFLLVVVGERPWPFCRSTRAFSDIAFLRAVFVASMVRRGGRESLVSLQLNCGKVQKRQVKLVRAVASVALGLVLASAASADWFWDS